MTTLNGLTRPWDAFIQTICTRMKKLKFDSLWEECIQEETTIANREALLSRDEDQALATCYRTVCRKGLGSLSQGLKPA
jgi:hypothetical protein